MNRKNTITLKLLEDTDIIVIGNKTRLCNLLLKELNYLIKSQKTNTCLNDYSNSHEFLRKNNEAKSNSFLYQKAILLLCVTGGVRTKSHNNKRTSEGLKDDFELINYLNKFWENIHIIYISSVLGLQSSKRNPQYSYWKNFAGQKLSKLLLENNKIKKLSIIYPGRLINNYIKFFVTGSFTYSRLVKLLIEIITKNKSKNHFLVGLDAFIFIAIKRPTLLKELSLRIL